MCKLNAGADVKEFGPELWISDGPVVTAAAGFRYSTRMAVIRLANGDLLIWSPTALSDDLRAELKALGTVRHLVPPNSLHHSFLAEWQQAYPEAIVYAPPGLREKRPGVRFDADLDGAPIAAWAEQIDLVVVRGNRITTEVVFFHRRSRTALFTDLLQHFPPGWFTGWRALVARLDLMVASEPSVPRKFRIAFSDRAAARDSVRRILAWPTENVLIAHGNPVSAGGQALLRRAFHWLVDE
jgi:hypothetical protein